MLDFQFSGTDFSGQNSLWELLFSLGKNLAGKNGLGKMTPNSKNTLTKISEIPDKVLAYVKQIYCSSHKLLKDSNLFSIVKISIFFFRENEMRMLNL